MIIFSILASLIFYFIIKILINFIDGYDDSVDEKIKEANEAINSIMNKPLKISFERFKSLYTMNPKAWNIEYENRVIYTYNTEETQWSNISNCYKKYPLPKSQFFEFGYFDSFKYQRWRKKQLAMYPEELVEAFQKDIDTFKEKAAKELENQVKRIEQYMDYYDDNNDEQWKENLKNVLLRICNRIEERKKAQ